MVNSWLSQVALIAAGGRFDGLRDRFSGRRADFDTGDMINGLIILGFVIAGIFLLSRLAHRHERGRKFNRPRSLFRELCKAHKLDRRSRSLLRRLARSHGLLQPARLFLEPERFAPEHLGSALRSEAGSLKRLHNRLFAATDPAQTPDGGNSMSPTKQSEDKRPLTPVG